MKTKLSASMTTLAALSLLFGIAISDVQAKSSGGHGGSSRSRSNSSSNRSYSSKSNGGHNNNRSYSSNRSNGNGHSSNNNYSSNRNSNGHSNNNGYKNNGHSSTSGNKSNGHSNGQKYNSHSKSNNNHGQRWNNHYGTGQHGHQRHGWNSWWYNYYAPLQNVGANNYRYYDGSYVSGDYTTSSGVVVQDVRWYLGLRGLILPGKGLGIEQVEDNSPANLAGLQQGMVITRINGVDMVDEAAMGRVIENSGGTLTMDVLDKLDGQVFSVTVSMRQMPVSSF